MNALLEIKPLTGEIQPGHKRLGMVVGLLAVGIFLSAVAATDNGILIAMDTLVVSAFLFTLYYLLLWCIGWSNANEDNPKKIRRYGAFVVLAGLGSTFVLSATLTITVLQRGGYHDWEVVGYLLMPTLPVVYALSVVIVINITEWVMAGFIDPTSQSDSTTSH